MTSEIVFGRQICGNLEESSLREWLCADGLGGFSFGTVAGLRTRRYHGLLITANDRASLRNLALASLDLTVKINGNSFQLATHEWQDGTISPKGYLHLEKFHIQEGVPAWTFTIGEVSIVVEVAMDYQKSAVQVSYFLAHSPDSLELEIKPLCTWRNADQERFGPISPKVETYEDGFVFEDSFRLKGPGYKQEGLCWYNGVYYRQEADRGLPPTEDLFCCGTFNIKLDPGQTSYIRAWAGTKNNQSDDDLVAKARQRRVSLQKQAGIEEGAAALLCGAADQFIIAGPNVIAGYPWFGTWSRDTLISYRGLFLATKRFDEGRLLLLRMSQEIKDGLLPNTAIAEDTLYNSADAPLWFIQAVFAHYLKTNDKDLLSQTLPALMSITDNYIRGTKYNIGLDQKDGLINCGANNMALTWMDARINNTAVTMRAGKPVEINALWVSGLEIITKISRICGIKNPPYETLYQKSLESFMRRFPNPSGTGLYDVLDSYTDETELKTPEKLVNDTSCRPNQLLALALGLFDADNTAQDPFHIMQSVAPLITSKGLRSLSPSDSRYLGRHRGNSYQRDMAYHQGTVWPYLMGGYADAVKKLGAVDDFFLDGLKSHIFEYGLGSVSETFEGDPAHMATGCPFQAWSVAESLRLLTDKIT